MHFSLDAPQGAVNFAAEKEARGIIHTPDSKMKGSLPASTSGIRQPDSTTTPPEPNGGRTGHRVRPDR